MSPKLIVNISVSTEPLLKRTREVSPLLLSDIKCKDAELLFIHIKIYLEEITPQMQTSMNTILENHEYVYNVLKSHYSNGIIEGINHYIKVLKRIAFGYKIFFHFRNKIIIARNLVKPKERFKAA